MTPLDLGIGLALVAGVGGVVFHHQFWRARKSRIQTEADAFDGRLDDAE